MFEKKLRWHKIAGKESELPFEKDENLVIAEVNRKKITLAKYDGNLFACAYTCPHAGAILADGEIDAKGNLICPLHGYKFSLLQNGFNTSGEGYALTMYKLKIDNEGVFIGM